MQQTLEDYDDAYAGLTADILKNISIHIYTMQEYFQFNPLQIRNEESISKEQMIYNRQSDKKKAVTMFYNKVISECICDLHIMNKLINAKAKVMNAILDNGISIARKKNYHWNQFIHCEGFQNVKKCYQLLTPQKKNIIKYSVMSISNLLLKLSINMSKVSVIPLQKFLNFEYLNIHVLSIAFLQYLHCNLFKTKSSTDSSQLLNFFGHLPRISFIKLNYYKNNTDWYILQNSQKQFITKQARQTVKNLQFIQIHQKSIDPFYPKFQRQTDYEYIYSIDLQQLSAKTISSPFQFQILEIMRQIIFPLVKDFKPDLIVYMESYPSGHIVMNDQIRGLMICQMAEQTCCNKMYQFKQMGPNKLDIQQYQKFNKNGQQINQRNQQIFRNQEQKIPNLYIKKSDLTKKNISLQQNKRNIQNLNRIKKIFINELCYVSLALIQKTTFDNILQKSHKQFYKRLFLQGILKQQSNIIQKCKQKKNQKNFQSLINVIKIKMEGVKLMLTVLKFHDCNVIQDGYKIIPLTSKQNEFKSFFNLQDKCRQYLTTLTPTDNTPIEHCYGVDDNFIVKYYDNNNTNSNINIKRLKVIIMKKITEQKKNHLQMTILSKTSQDINMKLQKQVQLSAQDNYLQGATYICSNTYLYRGFGRFMLKKNNNSDQFQYNNAIHRFKIDPEVGNDWELVDNLGIAVKSDGKQQPNAQLQKKMHGYGIYDADNRQILMMGGYIDESNQQKISRKIYVIKLADIYNGKEAEKKIFVLGKTNKIVYNHTSSLKNMLLHPFVYGIPFSSKTLTSQKGEAFAFVLNSNGYYLNLNHTNKIFSTFIKLSPVLTYNGIYIQNKLVISSDLDLASAEIFIAQMLIKCMVFFPHQINVYGFQCCVQTLEQGQICLDVTPNFSKKTLQFKVKASKVFQDDIGRILEFV